MKHVWITHEEILNFDILVSIFVVIWSRYECFELDKRDGNCQNMQKK